MSLAYSDAEIDLIAGWLKAGLSANVIATLLSEARRATVSRNAIIGLVRRHATLNQIGFARCKPGPKVARTPKPKVGAARAPSPSARIFGDFAPAAPGAPRGGFAPRVEKPKPVDVAEYDAASRRVALLDLKARDCRYVVNDPPPGGQHLFCALPAEPGSSYCPHHRSRCCAGLWLSREAA